MKTRISNMERNGANGRVKEGSVALVAFGGNAFFETVHKGSVEEQKESANLMCSKLLFNSEIRIAILKGK